MATDDTPRPIDPYAAELIRRKARQLCRRPGFAPQDRADLEQELIARLLARLHAFDSGQANAEAFTYLIVKHAVADLLRRRHARKRDDSSTFPLDGPNRDGDLPDKHTVQHHVDLRLDLAEILPTLPAELRELAQALEAGSLARAARLLGIPRTTASGHLQRLRAALEDRGLLES